MRSAALALMLPQSLENDSDEHAADTRRQGGGPDDENTVRLDRHDDRRRDGGRLVVAATGFGCARHVGSWTRPR